ncbi:MAG: putative primosomal protein n, partial [Actinomycetota bacterium]
MVPDVSGLDRVFDYAIPPALVGAARPGCRVSVPLHGRAVKGWIVAVGSREELALDHVVPENLVEISSVSGRSVDAALLPLTAEVARRWRGPRRAVLASASAPRVRSRPASSRRSHPPAKTGRKASAFETFLEAGGGVVHVAPGASVLTLAVEAAAHGPVLVVCPTHRMARLGAAWLRRAGLTTAEVPDEWERAEAGVDVVVGARSAVWAPCPGMRTVIVVDEHDDALKEDRVPAWDAASVAVLRAESLAAAWILASPVPSARAMRQAGSRVFIAPGGWPHVVVEDLNGLGAPGSLLGSHLLAELGRSDSTVACVLTTTGGARLLVCDACRSVQRCRECAAALALDEGGTLRCPRCAEAHGGVCTVCGRGKLRTLRGGHAHLGREVERSTG